MSYILIIDPSNTERGKQLAKIFSTALPNIDIYISIFNLREKVYQWQIWDKENQRFNQQDIPENQAKLAFRHYRDDDVNIPNLPELEIWYGGTGIEKDKEKQWNIYYRLGDNKDVIDIMKSERLKELWNWANNDNRDNLALPFLLRLPTPKYLISLSILCQGYLATYQDSRLPNFKSLEQELIDQVSTTHNQKTVNNINNWWIAVLNQNQNWQEEIKKELTDFAYDKLSEEELRTLNRFVEILSEAKTKLTQDLVYRAYEIIAKVIK